MDFEGFRAWLDAYVRACETNDPQDVGRLFTEDAEYYPGPFDEPYRGSASIAEHWADDPWTVGPRFDARAEPLLFEDGLGATLAVFESASAASRAAPPASFKIFPDTPTTAFRGYESGFWLPLWRRARPMYEPGRCMSDGQFFSSSPAG